MSPAPIDPSLPRTSHDSTEDSPARPSPLQDLILIGKIHGPALLEATRAQVAGGITLGGVAWLY